MWLLSCSIYLEVFFRKWILKRPIKMFCFSFLPLDPSKCCKLGLWTCTNHGVPSDPSASLLTRCLTNDVHVNVKPTVCARLSTAPFISDLIGRLASREFRGTFQDAVRSLPLAAPFFQSWDANCGTISCTWLGPANLHLTRLGFNRPHPRNTTRHISSRFVSRITSSSCAGCRQQEVLPLLLPPSINPLRLVEWLRICSQPFTDLRISVFN